MPKEIDSKKLSSPMVYLWKMVIFLIIAAFIFVILNQQIVVAFNSNPGLNGLIFFVGLIGILLTLVRVIRLFREVSWVNNFQMGQPLHEMRYSPVMLAPMATLLGNKFGEMAISTMTMRSLMDSIATRLDESRETSRYLTGLLVFLGLLGTFWGLLQTVASIGTTIQSLNIGSGEVGIIFEDLKSGLEAPLAGMGTAFSSSLFGLTGSLILGFLDLQAGQSQSRFYNELEDWLSSVTEVDWEEIDSEDSQFGVGGLNEVRNSIERLAKTVQSGKGNEEQNAVLANLAEGIGALVQHVRDEQQMMRDWAAGQTEQQKRIEELLIKLNEAISRPEKK